MTQRGWPGIERVQNRLKPTQVLNVEWNNVVANFIELKELLTLCSKETEYTVGFIDEVKQTASVMAIEFNNLEKLLAQYPIIQRDSRLNLENFIVPNQSKFTKLLAFTKHEESLHQHHHLSNDENGVSGVWRNSLSPKNNIYENEKQNTQISNQFPNNLMSESNNLINHAPTLKPTNFGYNPLFATDHQVNKKPVSPLSLLFENRCSVVSNKVCSDNERVRQFLEKVCNERSTDNNKCLPQLFSQCSEVRLYRGFRSLQKLCQKSLPELETIQRLSVGNEPSLFKQPSLSNSVSVKSDTSNTYYLEDRSTPIIGFIDDKLRCSITHATDPRPNPIKQNVLNPYYFEDRSALNISYIDDKLPNYAITHGEEPTDKQNYFVEDRSALNICYIDNQLPKHGIVHGTDVPKPVAKPKKQVQQVKTTKPQAPQMLVINKSSHPYKSENIQVIDANKSDYLVIKFNCQCDKCADPLYKVLKLEQRVCESIPKHKKSKKTSTVVCKDLKNVPKEASTQKVFVEPNNKHTFKPPKGKTIEHLAYKKLQDGGRVKQAKLNRLDSNESGVDNSSQVIITPRFSTRSIVEDVESSQQMLSPNTIRHSVLTRSESSLRVYTPTTNITSTVSSTHISTPSSTTLDDVITNDIMTTILGIKDFSQLATNEPLNIATKSSQIKRSSKKTHRDTRRSNEISLEKSDIGIIPNENSQKYVQAIQIKRGSTLDEITRKRSTNIRNISDATLDYPKNRTYSKKDKNITNAKENKKIIVPFEKEKDNSSKVYRAKATNLNRSFSKKSQKAKPYLKGSQDYSETSNKHSSWSEESEEALTVDEKLSSSLSESYLHNTDYHSEVSTEFSHLVSALSPQNMQKSQISDYLKIRKLIMLLQQKWGNNESYLPTGKKLKINNLESLKNNAKDGMFFTSIENAEFLQSANMTNQPEAISRDSETISRICSQISKQFIQNSNTSLIEKKTLPESQARSKENLSEVNSYISSKKTNKSANKLYNMGENESNSNRTLLKYGIKNIKHYRLNDMMKNLNLNNLLLKTVSIDNGRRGSLTEEDLSSSEDKRCFDSTFSALNPSLPSSSSFQEITPNSSNPINENKTTFDNILNAVPTKNQKTNDLKNFNAISDSENQKWINSKNVITNSSLSDKSTGKECYSKSNSKRLERINPSLIKDKSHLRGKQKNNLLKQSTATAVGKFFSSRDLLNKKIKTLASKTKFVSKDSSSDEIDMNTEKLFECVKKINCLQKLSKSNSVQPLERNNSNTVSDVMKNICSLNNAPRVNDKKPSSNKSYLELNCEEFCLENIKTKSNSLVTHTTSQMKDLILENNNKKSNTELVNNKIYDCINKLSTLSVHVQEKCPSENKLQPSNQDSRKICNEDEYLILTTPSNSELNCINLTHRGRKNIEEGKINLRNVNEMTKQSSDNHPILIDSKQIDAVRGSKRTFFQLENVVKNNSFNKDYNLDNYSLNDAYDKRSNKAIFTELLKKKSINSTHKSILNLKRLSKTEDKLSYFTEKIAQFKNFNKCRHSNDEYVCNVCNQRESSGSSSMPVTNNELQLIFGNDNTFCKNKVLNLSRKGHSNTNDCNYNDSYSNIETNKSLSISRSKIREFSSNLDELACTLEEQMELIATAFQTVGGITTLNTEQIGKPQTRSWNYKNFDTTELYNQFFSVKKSSGTRQLKSRTLAKNTMAKSRNTNTNILKENFKNSQGTLQMMSMELSNLRTQLDLTIFQQTRDKIASSDCLEKSEREKIIEKIDEHLLRIKANREQIEWLLDHIQKKLAIEEELESLHKRLEEEFESKFKYSFSLSQMENINRMRQKSFTETKNLLKQNLCQISDLIQQQVRQQNNLERTTCLSELATRFNCVTPSQELTKHDLRIGLELSNKTEHTSNEPEK